VKLYKGLVVFGAVISALFFMAADGYSFTCPNPPVKLGSNGLFYNTIMLAYGAAVDGDIIKLEANPYEEDLDLNSGKTILLDGGYDDCSFLNNSLVTEIAGSLTISGGTVIVSNIVLSSPVIYDADGDGYTAIGSCSGSGDDCNDNNASIHPFGEIYGDGINQDCIAGDVTATEQTCINCHGLNSVNGNSANPYTNYHVSVSAPDGTCVDCHAGQINAILPGHYGQTVRTTGNNMDPGDTIVCSSCHDQNYDTSDEHDFGANIVAAKIAADWPNVTCDTCHDNRAAGHATDTAHDNRIIDSSCGQCHGTLATQADVDTLHGNNCSLCHAYTGTKICAETVRQVIEDGLNGNQVSCLDCHTAHHSPETNQVRYDPAVDTSQPTEDGCAVCHMDYDLANGTSLGLSTWETILVEHDLDGTKDGSSNTCANCHAYDGSGSAPLSDVQAAIASGSATCATCHTDKVPDITHGIPTSGKHTAHLDMAGINFDCEFCHTSAPYFQSGTDANSDGKYDLSETDVCNPCHQDWDPAGLPAEQDYKAGWGDAGFTMECTDCHGEVVNNGDDIPVDGRRAVTGEFPASSHAHYGALLDSASCQVCHDYTNHADGTVNLLDPDGGPGYDFVNATDLTTDPDLSNFCANCHDDNGATRLVLPLDPLDPFANGNVPPDVASRFMGTLQWYEWYTDSCYGSEGSNRPVNSHHDISDADQIFSGAKIECLDCHGSHTSAGSQKLTDPFVANEAWIGTLNEFCLACHNGGHDPMRPMFPADIGVPVFYTPPPDNIPGESCGPGMVYDCSGSCFNQETIDTELTNNSCNESVGLNLDCNIFNYDNEYCLPENTPATECGTDMYWDCNDNCLDLFTLYGDPAVNNDGALENSLCDEAAGLDLNCTEFKYDSYACNACEGNDCSYIGGIDSCSYGDNPWYIDITWTNSAHGPDSKRDWAGYSGAPTYTMECIACHDSHGSYTTTNTGGNPYMLRDYVDGTQFIDDGVRPSAQWNGPPWETTGVGGDVIIINPTATDIGPQIGDQLCAKCHATWSAAYSWHSYCNGCLTCHSHGMAFGGNDWGGAPSDVQFCP